MSLPFINITGIRNNEIIVASSKATQNVGTEMIVRGYYPPGPFIKSFDDYEILRDYSFFKNMKNEEIKKYLLDNYTENDDLYLDDTDVEVKFLKIGGKFMVDSLGPENIKKLLNSDFLQIKDVYNMFPRKLNSRAKKHSLIFRPSNWQLSKETIQKSFTGIIINLNTFSFKSEKNYTLNEHSVKVSDNILILYENNEIFTEDDAFNIINDIYDEEKTDDICKLIKWFPPSLHKSLIQKIIRTRCKNVIHKGYIYNANHFLIISFTMLLFHPGAFVPNIQTFVTGTESACKRLAVSICEDSYTEDYQQIMFLFSASFYKKNKRDFNISKNMYMKWINLYDRKDVRMFEYNTKDTFLKNDLNEYFLSAKLLEILRSFETDINMFKSICNNNGINREIKKHVVKDMELTHCVDHHSYTDIAWFYPVEKCNFKNYSEMFKYIWDRNSGYNPRKNVYDLSEDVVIAQKRFWESRMEKEEENIEDIETEEDGEIIQFTETLSDSILASSVGIIEIKFDRTEVYALINPNNIYDYKFIRRPSRDNKSDLTDEDKDTSYKILMEKFKIGIKFKFFDDNCILSIIDDEYCLKIDKKYIKWEIVKHKKYEFSENGVSFDWKKLLKKLIENTNEKVIRRLHSFIDSYNDKINLFPISRDGDGTEYSVNILDTFCFDFLCKFCSIFPGIIELNKSTFIIKNSPVFWSLRKCIFYKTKNVKSSVWKMPIEDSRKLWEHQREALNKMIVRHNSGEKGNLIWVSVGLGKTLIVINYITYLIKNNKMPSYCVMAIPPSASDSVCKEFEMYSIDINKIDMRKTSKNKNLIKNVVNIVNHDHMRLMSDQLLNNADDMLFIVDEFHKTMNKTQRTSIALEVCKISREFIGMSGTILNGEPDDIIQWLELISDFPVNEKNYWVGVSSLISNRIQTNVVVIRENIEIVIEWDRNESFRKLVNDCYEKICEGMIDFIKKCKETVFIVVRDKNMQIMFKEKLSKKKVFCIGLDGFITYDGKGEKYDCVITTVNHSAGYTLTGIGVMITSVWFSNQNTREQLDGRINRIGQERESVKIYTFHGGILSLILDRYERVRSLADGLKQLQKIVEI